MQIRTNEAIQTHYTCADLGDVILTALQKAGKDVNRLTPEDLAPIDQFHIRGRMATLELARAAGLDAAKRVLDVGSGAGATAKATPPSRKPPLTTRHSMSYGQSMWQ